MASPSSDIDICNLALDTIGQEPIATLESPTLPSEEVCARWYDHTRQKVLREYIWKFAKHTEDISRVETPDHDWASAYALPNDYLRFLSVGGEIEIYQSFNYDIQGNLLLLNSDAAVLPLRYVRDVTDVPKWDSLFRNIMVLQLALNISYKFTLKASVVERVEKALGRELPKAITVNSQERPARRIQTSRYLRARRTGLSDVAGPYTVFDD